MTEGFRDLSNPDDNTTTEENAEKSEPVEVVPVDAPVEESDLSMNDITATGEVRTEPEEPEFSNVQPQPGEEFDHSTADQSPLGFGGEVVDDSNKEGAPATTRETGNVSKDFEEAVKAQVEQNDQDEVAANSGPRPLGIPEANQVVVVEPQAEQSGYIIDTGEHNAQPYAVQADSVLSGLPWNIQAGTIIGRSQNPPLSDDLAKELGLDKLVQ